VTGERRAVVVGGSRGIGRAVVARLATDGFRVVATGRDPASLEQLRDGLAARGLEVDTAVADATDEAATRRLADEVGDVDALVVNAGASSAAPLARTDLDTWQHLLQVNATGAFLALRAFVPSMVARGVGRAVVVASTAALSGSPYISAYAASKHAALGLVRSVAAEVAGRGVTVNAVCPHFVDTDMTEDAVTRIQQATGREASAARDELAHSSRLGRLIEPEEVAAAVAMLVGATDDTINGQALVLDGGGHW
jgi:NAD(P)-dependent dehydrogenase (short-subunit alcohol dehydrogenase family)